MLISIITINYNDVAGLERTIKSVQEQTLTNYEHILIDGGSTDGSAALTEQHQDNFSYWVSEPDDGIYHAMNKGIAVARGDYLLFLNSGDHFKNKSSLSTLVGGIDEKQQVELVYGNIEVVADHTWIKKYPVHLTLDYLIKDSLPHPATLIRKACFNNQLYDTSLSIVSDWKFFLLGVGQQSFNFTHVDHTISVFYYDGLSSMQQDKIAQERQKMIARYFPEKLPLHRSYYPSAFSRKITNKKKQVLLLCNRLFKKVTNG
ncbi:glycosyltransferase family 2 protein [Nonlabens sp.]|uniref:glycosyltransferase family 2 protein n=1 Tax=Nonlabens sp. TaxID=1888209 RepID=UPI0025CF368D|nr:glycosyltransferase family 2 protein [Nonlabens sp.]